MSEHRHIPEPGETIQVPRSSWGPPIFAVGAIGAVVGIYANGFILSAFIWSYLGIIILLFAFRSIIRGAARSYFSLPRRQYPPSATLPMDQIHLEKRPAGSQLPR